MGIVDSVRFRVDGLRRLLGKHVRGWLATINDAPVFVLGNQKSGTTAIAVLLAERTGHSVTWDPTSPQHDSLIVDIYQEAASISTLVQQCELAFSKDVVKDPNLTFVYDALQERFPDAQFVMVMRDPRDNVRSILDRLDLPGDATSLDSERYEAMSQGWRLVVDGSWMGIQGEHYIDSLAGRWQRAARIYLENEDTFQLIRYEDFMDAKVAAIDGLAARLGLEAKHGIEDKVDQQFQPRGHRRDANWPTFFGESNLRRIEIRCAEEMNALGYDSFHTM